MISAAQLQLTKHGERFCPPFSWGHLSLALGYLGIGIVYTLMGPRSYRVFPAIGYAVLGAAYLPGYFFTWWELRPEGIFERRFWRTRMVPYSTICLIGSWDENPKGAEIQYADMNPEIFPRGSMVVLTADITGFLQRLRELAPSADFRM